MGYVVSRGGTFGTIRRRYTTEDGIPMCVIEWGPLGWLTCVRQVDCHRLVSPYEREARDEAEKWLASPDVDERGVE